MTYNSGGTQTPSSLADLDTCEQLFVLKHKEGWRAAQEAEALLKGRLIHVGLAAWWGGDFNEYEPLRLSVDAELRESVRARSASEAIEDMQKAYFGAADPALPFREALNEVLLNYAEYREPLRQRALPWMIERRLPGAEGESGQLDLLLWHEDRFKLVDHKSTSGYFSQDWLAQWRLNEQLPSYMDYAELALGRDIETYVIDGIKLPGAKAARPSGEWLCWHEFTPTRSQREELRRQRMYKVARARLLAQGEPPLARFTSCRRYGRLCEFFEVCASPPEEREATLAMLAASGVLQNARLDAAEGNVTLGAEEAS